MQIRKLTVTTAYNEFNSMVDVIAVTGDGPGKLCVEYHDGARENIAAFLEGTTWEIVDEDDFPGQFPQVYVGPETDSPS